MISAAALEAAGLERMGPDSCTVYRSRTASRPCLLCGRSTLLLVVFKPGGAPLALCGTCRGY